MLARRIGGELSRLGNLAARGDNSCELSRAMAGGVISEKGITGGTGWAGVGLVRVRAFWCSCVLVFVRGRETGFGGFKGLCA
jgi:hypothetical protein